MHNDYVRPDGQWPPEFVLTGGDLRRFDVAQSQAVNWDAGGTWIPVTPITIGGAALFLTGGVVVGHTLSGGIATLSGGRIYLGASIYPSFQAPYSRAIQWPLLAQRYISHDPPGTVFSVIGIPNIIYPIESRALHNGGTLATANVAMAVGQKHLSLPGQLPQVQIVRDDWAPWVPNVWSGTTVYPVGSIVQPTHATSPGLVYVSTVAGGTSSSSEPNWSTAATINSSPATDGSVTWVATGFNGSAQKWQAATTYAVGAVVQPTPRNGLVYTAIAVTGTGTSGATQPTFPLSPTTTVIDNPGANQITWQCVGTPRAAHWLANTIYKKGVIVTAIPDNGFYYESNAAGTSGLSSPGWGTTVGGLTADGSGTFHWVCIGTNPVGAGSLVTPANADSYYAGGVIQTLSVPCFGANVIDTVNHSYALIAIDEAGVGSFQTLSSAPWAASQGYESSPIYLDSSFVQPVPPNGFFYVYETAGTALAIGVSGSTQPTWPTVIGGISAADGSVAGWECVGPVNASLNFFMSVAFSFTSIADMRPE